MNKHKWWMLWNIVQNEVFRFKYLELEKSSCYVSYIILFFFSQYLIHTDIIDFYARIPLKGVMFLIIQFCKRLNYKIFFACFIFYYWSDCSLFTLNEFNQKWKILCVAIQFSRPHIKFFLKTVGNIYERTLANFCRHFFAITFVTLANHTKLLGT